MRTSAILVLAGLVVGSAFADDQIDSELRARDEAAKKAPKSFSWIDDTLNLEYVYKIDAATAEKLPAGDNKSLTADQKNALEDTITAIRKNDPLRVVAVNKDKETATAAHRRYRQVWYYQPRRVHVDVYCGGGFYYVDYGYDCSWQYRGSYYWPGRQWRNCYWW